MRIAGVHYMSKKLDELIKNAIEEEALLERQKRILEREDARIKREKLRPLIGMAFKNGTKYFCITDVPKFEWVDGEMTFSPYRIPCKVLTEAFGKIISEEDSFVFSNAVSASDVKAYIRKEYIEIPRELFDEKLGAFEGTRLENKA